MGPGWWYWVLRVAMRMLVARMAKRRRRLRKEEGVCRVGETGETAGRKYSVKDFAARMWRSGRRG